MMRIDLVGQFCAGEVCASAPRAATTAAAARVARNVRRSRMCASVASPIVTRVGRSETWGRRCRQMSRPPDFVSLNPGYMPPCGLAPRNPPTRGTSLPQTLQPPAVEIERHSGDVACAFRAQEHDGVGKLCRRAEAAQRIFARRDSPRVVVRLNAQLPLQPLRIHAPKIGVDPAR